MPVKLEFHRQILKECFKAVGGLTGLVTLGILLYRIVSTAKVKITLI
ncbi:hypothetical protein AQBE111736_03325 [Aquirufa beregesia]